MEPQLRVSDGYKSPRGGAVRSRETAVQSNAGQIDTHPIPLKSIWLSTPPRQSQQVLATLPLPDRLQRKEDPLALCNQYFQDARKAQRNIAAHLESVASAVAVDRELGR